MKNVKPLAGTESRPADPDLDGPDPRPGEEEAARQLFVTFGKTLKTIQLYPSNNKLSVAAVGDLLSSFTEFLSRFGELAVDVEESRLGLRGRPMFEESVRSHSIPWRLHCDGVRRLVFRPGLPERELLTFLDILGHPPAVDDPEDDVVSRLWEEDLPHIRYLVLDTDSPVEDPHDLSRGLQHGESDGLVRHSEEACGEPAHGDPRPKRSPPPLVTGTSSDLLTITDRDREALAEMISHDGRRDLRQDLTTLLFELLDQQRDEDAFQNTVGVLGLLLRSFLKAGDVSAAIDVLRRLRSVLETEAPTFHHSIVRSQIGICSGPETTGLLAGLLAKHDRAHLQHIQEFIDLLAPSSGAVLSALLPHAEDAGLLEHLVRRIGETDAECLRGLLGGREPALVLRVIAAIAAIGNPDHADWLMPLLSSPDIPLRFAAVRALGRLGGARAKGGLISALENPESQVRMQALRTIAERPDPSLLPLLLRHAESKETAGRDLFELQEICRTIAITGRETALAWLLSEVDRQSRLPWLRRDDRRAAAAAGLGFVGGPAARESVATRIPAATGRVRDALRGALRRLDDAGDRVPRETDR
ncbi:MAG: HEAT repeat domain-containing protein [Planctomycetes bacterium]|jgi:hypothetical protein|nr:HEAT repeat domain-containing protein [Planctomycetota bacterium]